MRFKVSYYSSNFLRIIFVLSIVMLLLISSISYRHNLNLSDSNNKIIHTYRVNNELENLISLIKDAETNQRGYIITRGDIFLNKYRSKPDKITISFKKLERLIDGNLRQQNEIRQIKHLTQKTLNSFEESIKYSEVERYDEQKLKDYLQLGRILMENIRFRVDEMKLTENKIIKQRQEKLESEILFTPFFTIIISFLSILIVIFAYKQIIKDISTLNINNKNLLIASKLMSESEVIGIFSTWKWDLNQQTITFSDNFALLLGKKPSKITIDKKHFLDLIYVYDKEKVSQWMKNIVVNKQLPFIQYRMIREDGSIGYFKSVGKLLHEEGVQNLILGITFDISEEELQKEILSERNHELEKSNEELASFNRVASHDLQEPLRKIQTFISLIPDDQKEILSIKSREYLGKIETSASRMRVLIDDLLLFSKTIASKKEFVNTNLNELFDDTIIELAELIEEKNAKIKFDKFPSLKVVPYQIKQLFINLISNSLKYSRDDIETKIVVNCKKVASRSHPDLLDQSLNWYYQFTFTDNGIGFDPQFKKNIFILFQRLHSTSEYAGTGIGLAICKKIIENHKGVIIADSEPNKGSVFTFFLPI